MNQNLKKLLPALVYFLGGGGCMVRLMLYRYALDEKGLLVAGHPLNLCLMGLMALVLVLVFFPEKEKAPFRALEAPYWLPGLGALALALALLTLEIPFFRGDLIEKLCGLLRLAAAAVQLWAAISHFRKKEPFFGCNGLTGLFFALFIICAYPVWSGNPQVHRYILMVFALIGLGLTAYGQAAFATGLGWPKGHFPTALLTTFLCLSAIPESGAPVFLLGGAIWAVCTLHRGNSEV